MHFARLLRSLLRRERVRALQAADEIYGSRLCRRLLPLLHPARPLNRVYTS